MDGAIQRLNNQGLVVKLIVFDRISNLLSTHTGKTHIWKGVDGNLESNQSTRQDYQKCDSEPLVEGLQIILTLYPNRPLCYFNEVMQLQWYCLASWTCSWSRVSLQFSQVSFSLYFCVLWRVLKVISKNVETLRPQHQCHYHWVWPRKPLAVSMGSGHAAEVYYCHQGSCVWVFYRLSTQMRHLS